MPATPPPISSASFQTVRNLVRRDPGFSLDSDKVHYVGYRLEGLGKRHRKTLDQLVARAAIDASLREEVVEAILNHETSFFRDWSPFLALRDEILPALIRRRAEQKVLRLWSAACSFGQEPFSLALLLFEHFASDLEGWQIELLGSDVSAEALDRARAGVYSRHEMNRGLPADLLLKHFESREGKFQLAPALRERVRFEQINLLGTWPSLPAFDVILLRNVLIYFEVDDKVEVLRRMRGALRSDGALLLGSPETTLLLDPAWVPRHVGGSVVYELAQN